MSDYLPFIIVGLVSGSVYGIASTGLVLGKGVGTATITASLGAVNAHIDITVANSPTSIAFDQNLFGVVNLC